jgi:hypothetical protein
MIVRATVAGPLKILVLDATCNKKGFEHDLSRRVHAALQAGGIGVSGPPVFARGPGEIEDALQADFSLLLYVAHGGARRGKDSATVQAGEFDTNWYYLQHLKLNLKDKMVCLCVCHGSNADSLETILRGEQLALIMVGPRALLDANEAEAFFPDFLKRLHEMSPGDIDPNVVRAVLDETNGLAGGKMDLFSPGLSAQ